MTPIPQDPLWESTLALLGDPYRYIGSRCRQLGTSLFEARILLRKTLCMSGSEAAAVFHQEEFFSRVGAAPEPMRNTLLGNGGVQGLDAEAHRRRKALFLSLMTPERTEQLVALVVERWHDAARQWEGEVSLYDALHGVLTRAACQWAGVPLPEADARQRTRELTALFDAAGAIGFRHLWARFARWRADNWAEGIIRAIRSGNYWPPESSAAHAIAFHVEPNGEHLPARVAAVELLNVVRPVVAVSVFLVFTALALHRHPECRERLLNEPEYAEWFAHEVRRFFPFFPALTALVRKDFEWKGYRLRKGRWTLLDVYGTNHDPRVWENPEAFRPERFQNRPVDLFGFIPQGGGDAKQTHRCPGERPTIELMKATALLLAGQMTYRVPEQDLSVDMSRLPALPKSRLVIRDVRMRPAHLAT